MAREALLPLIIKKTHFHPTGRHYIKMSDDSSSTSSETPTLHLPNFKWRHLIGALNQMVPELLQLFLKFRINGPDKYNVF